MRAVVCGAGQVGAHIARFLARRGVDVTVVDHDRHLVAVLAETADVRTVLGNAAHPEILREAGVSEADILIAVTNSDEVNIVVCEVTNALFPVPLKIARIRHQGYFAPGCDKLFGKEELAIDHVISPEVEVARSIDRRLRHAGAFEAFRLMDGRLMVLGARALAGAPEVGHPAARLPGNPVVLFRGDRTIVAPADTVIEPGDELYVACGREEGPAVLESLGHAEVETRRILIIGGGNVGQSLARRVVEWEDPVDLRLIEHSDERARRLAQALDGAALVFEGDALDAGVLREAGVAKADVVVCVTNDDETNVLAALLAKQSGARRTVALVTRGSYRPVLRQLGIDAHVDPASITVSRILERVRRGRVYGVHLLRDGAVELIDAEIRPDSPVTQRKLGALSLPKGAHLVALSRGEILIGAEPQLTLRGGDRVVFACLSEQVQALERMVA